MSNFVKQIGKKDCAFACVKMLLSIVYKSNKFLTYPQASAEKSLSLDEVMKICEREGVKLYAFRFKKKEDLLKQESFPLLAPLIINGTFHMVLIKKIKKNKLYVYDPARSPLKINFLDFVNYWNGECLEVEEVKGSLYQKKKHNFISWPYKIFVPLLQLASFIMLVLALFFIDERFSFLYSVGFLLSFILLEFAHRTLLLKEMRNFDKRMLLALNSRSSVNLRTRFIKMNDFKVMFVGGPIEMLNLVLIISLGIVILGINSYLNLINLFLMTIFSIGLLLLEKKIFKNNANSIYSFESSLIDLKVTNEEELKKSVDELNNKTYSFVTFKNVVRSLLLFLAVIISLLYSGFSGDVSINFVLFHAFFYFYLSTQVSRLYEVIASRNDIHYYISLYQYYLDN